MSLDQPDSTASPMTLTPRDEYSFSSLLNSGISLTQFSHQVAQKSSTTILSLRSSDRSVRPSSCDSENCGTESGCWPAAVANKIQTKTNALIYVVTDSAKFLSSGSPSYSVRPDNTYLMGCALRKHTSPLESVLKLSQECWCNRFARFHCEYGSHQSQAI